MEQDFQTSFIPKKPIIKDRAESSRPIGIIMLASIFILFAVFLITGGLYFYKTIVNKNISDMENSLNLAQNRFEPSKITELQVLDKRLRASTEILSQHITTIPIFTVLESLTMKTVRYTNFSYSLGSQNTVDVKMSGVAIGYRSIALQSDILGANKDLINPVFSNLSLDNSGNVLFDLDFSVDPNFVNYKKTLLTQS